MANVNGTNGKDFIHVAGDGNVAPAGYIDNPGATSNADVITPLAGDDIIFAGGGSDTIDFGANFNALDQVDGGAGNNDKMLLTGNYLNGVIFGAATLVNVETIKLGDGFNYTLTSHEQTVASSGLMTVDASALGGSYSATFFGQAETDGRFSFIGGAGSDWFVGSAKADTFDFTLGGFDSGAGGSGADTFLMGASMTYADQLDGGGGLNDLVIVDGDYTSLNYLGFGPGTMKNVETLQLTGGHSYSVQVGTDDLVAAGKSLLIDASTLTAADSLQLQDSFETDGFVSVIGGAGNDQLGIRNAFNGGASIDGGDGTDWLIASGSWSAPIVFSDTTLLHIESVSIEGTGDASLTFTDANVDAGTTFLISRPYSSAADTLHLDASAETDANLVVTGAIGDDVILTGAGNDSLNIGTGADEAHCGDGADVIDAVIGFSADDQLDGGAGSLDKLYLHGDYAAGVTLLANTISNIETIQLSNGFSYKLTMADGNVAAGQTLEVDGGSLTVGQIVTVNAAAELDGSYDLVGGQGNDVLTGGAQADRFFLQLGGDDTVNGGGGNDLFHYEFATGFSALDKIDGGIGDDTVEFIGGIASPVVMNATTMLNVETIKIASLSSFIDLTTNDATVGAGKSLAVDFGSNVASDVLWFDGTAETNGKFVVTTAAGGGIVKTGAGADTINSGWGGNLVIKSGGGDDSISFGTTFNNDDAVDGGTGTDTLTLLNDYTLTFQVSTMVNVEVLKLTGRHGGTANYDLKMIEENVASGQQLKVDGSGATGLKLDASAETNGKYAVIGSKAADTIVTGLGSDSIQGGLGKDDLSGKGGNDIFVYTAVADSTNQGRDLIRDFVCSNDKFDLNAAVTGIDFAVTTGTLNEGATFAANLAAAVGAAKLGAHHAVLFTASAGTLSGHEFLVVDANGVAGFQAGADYVMEINNPGIFGTLTTGNFI
jgi:Ca2+-binding RTX toxin-like protein